MTFDESLKKLGIEKYRERIFNSSSHGELFFLVDYIKIADSFDDLKWFPSWFDRVVKQAEKKWSRPESIFQHIPRCLSDSIGQEG